MWMHWFFSSQLPVRDPSIIALFWGFRLSWLGLGSHQLCGQGTLHPSMGPGEGPGTVARGGEDGAKQCWGVKGRGCFQRGVVFGLALLFLGLGVEGGGGNAAAGAALGPRG